MSMGGGEFKTLHFTILNYFPGIFYYTHFIDEKLAYRGESGIWSSNLIHSSYR